MNFSILLILVLLHFGTAYLHASKYQDKGVSGSLALTYEDREYILTNSSNKENIFVSSSIESKLIQEYKLGYDGNIFHPNLLQYTVSGLFRLEDTEMESGGKNGELKSNSEDFAITTSFFQNSIFPFRLYYSSSNRPSSSVYADDEIKLLAKSEDYGLSGLLKLDKLKLDYKASNQTTTDDDGIKFFERTIVKYGATLDYVDSADRFRLNFLNTKTDNKIYSNNTVNLDNSDVNSLSLSYSTGIFKDFKLSSDVNYETITTNDTEVFNANIGLTWSPKSDYKGSFNASFGRVDMYILDDLNASLGKIFDRTDTVDVNQFLSYTPMKNLRFSESISYFSFERPLQTSDTTIVDFSAQYSYLKVFTSQRSVDISSSVTERMEYINTTDSIEGKNESEKGNTVMLFFSTNLLEQLPSLNSLFKLTLSYNGTNNSNGQNVNSYTGSLFLSSKYGILNNSLNATYNINGDTKLITYGDRLNASIRTGYRGTIGAGLGIDAQETITKENSTKTEILKANLRFSYRFFTKLMFFATGNVDKELSYNTLTYIAESKLEYRVGKTSFDISYSYNNSTAEGLATVSKFLKARFIRTF